MIRLSHAELGREVIDHLSQPLGGRDRNQSIAENESPLSCHHDLRPVGSERGSGAGWNYQPLAQMRVARRQNYDGESLSSLLMTSGISGPAARVGPFFTRTVVDSAMAGIYILSTRLRELS
jgi:hypothetical protein